MYSPPNPSEKGQVVTINELLELTIKLRAEGKTIGLCVGGYDLLHAGHVRHFESAAKLCDILVVAVTCDEHVAARKGAGRPVIKQDDRAYMVSQLRTVDFSLVSPYEKAIELIQQLKPTYYIKGPDFKNKNTPGITAEREAIQAIGGSMIYTDDPTSSTTNIIRYIKEQVDRKQVLVVLDRDGTLIEEVSYLGREQDWRDHTMLKKAVVDFLIYLNTKYDITPVVVSNQQGVARGYFSTQTVEHINAHIATLLQPSGIQIANWQYCPHVDQDYALKHSDQMHFNPSFITAISTRKPNPHMLFEALKHLGKQLSDFDQVIMLGNSTDDAGMALAVDIPYIDVTDKTYDTLKKEFEQS